MSIRSLNLYNGANVKDINNWKKFAGNVVIVRTASKNAVAYFDSLDERSKKLASSNNLVVWDRKEFKYLVVVPANVLMELRISNKLIEGKKRVIVESSYGGCSFIVDTATFNATIVETVSEYF